MKINDKTLAQDCVERFVRRFDASYRLLACFAALPLVLTPDLLNYLRNRFLRGQVPWGAEVDLLLSELCSEVAYEQYAMSLPVRNYLLSEMRAKFGAQRQQEVARVLLDYVKHLARTKPAGSRPELEVQQWSAMLYIENQRADTVGQIAEAFRDLVSPAAADADAPPALDQTALARLVRITQALAPQLQDFPELVRYSEELSRLLTNPATVDQTPGGVEQSQDMVQLMGVELPSVAQVSRRMSAPFHKPATAEPRKARDRTGPKAAAQPITRPYKYDIFVSYAQVDDQPPPDTSAGWVTTLVDHLKMSLDMRLGRRDSFTLWMDHLQADNGQPWSEMPLDVLQNSAIIMIVLSPGYLASERCRREMAIFCETIKRRTDPGRPVFVIETQPVPREERPRELQDLLGYRFWTQDQPGRAPQTLGLPIWTQDQPGRAPQPTRDDTLYYRRINDLGSELAREIGRLRTSPPPAEAVQTTHEDKGLVFVCVEKADLPLAESIANVLVRHDIGFVLSDLDGTPSQAREDLELNLMDCDGLLLVYGKAPVIWVRERLRFARRILLSRKAPRPVIGIYEGPPDEKDSLGLILPNMLIIDGRKGLNESGLQQFINALTGQSSQGLREKSYPTKPARIFISHSHRDKRWADRLITHLTSLLREQDQVFSSAPLDDSRIGAGQDWGQALQDAMEEASVAVLLISADYLTSAFILREEIAYFLRRREQYGLHILPVIVSPCAWMEVDWLRKMQVRPRDGRSLSAGRRNQAEVNLIAIAMEIRDLLDGTEPNMRGRFREVVREIATNLQSTRTAFVAQIRRRDDLVEAIKRRLGIQNDQQYEKFFFQYFPELTETEKFEFDQIRAMTEGPLHNGNRRIMEILEEVPELLDELPALTDLRQHLVFWLSRFDTVFSQNKAMCLLFTGEDGVPFPSHIDDVVEEWLAKH